MLIATIVAILFLGSGANFMQEDLDQLEDRIKAEMSDDVIRNAQLNAALDVVDKMEDTADDYADADKDDEKALLKLIQQYESSIVDIQANMDISYNKRIEYQQHMLAFHHELKDKLSHDEWSRMFSADSKK